MRISPFTLFTFSDKEDAEREREREEGRTKAPFSTSPQHSLFLLLALSPWGFECFQRLELKC